MPKPDDIANFVENSADNAWVDQAACGDLPLDQLDLFFVEAGRTLSREAAALCAGCAVRQECLDHAMRREIGGGYFGGMSPSKRRAEQRTA